MKYVLDESAICYMLEAFPQKTVPNIYEKFCEGCIDGVIISDKETKKSLEHLLEEESSYIWIEEHAKTFRAINQKESKILGELVEEGIFSFINNSRRFSRNLPIAIPFLLAIALNEKRTVVMDKKARDSKIVEKMCREKGIGFCNVDDFLSELIG